MSKKWNWDFVVGLIFLGIVVIVVVAVVAGISLGVYSLVKIIPAAEKKEMIPGVAITILIFGVGWPIWALLKRIVKNNEQMGNGK